MAAKEKGHTAGRGAEYDVQEGLDWLSNVLYEARSKDAAFRDLQDAVSIRRNARGDSKALSAVDQLLLNELVYGLAVTGAIALGGNSVPPTASDQAHNDGNQSKLTKDDEPPLEVTVGGEDVDLSGPASDTPGARDHDKPGVPIEQLDPELEPYLPSSLVLFYHRFARSFPGTRDITWYEDREQISMRLARLFETPLVTKSGRTPIWWWRGGNLHIERFRQLEDGTYLMNAEELDIRLVAAVPGASYQWSFVYIETKAMERTGLYPSTPEDDARRLEYWGYDSEEYGLLRDGRKIRRDEYDDGAAEIDGRIIDTVGLAELRVRHITPYNFVVAAHGSPINNNDFDRILERYLNNALSGDSKAVVAKLAEQVQTLPLKPHSSG